MGGSVVPTWKCEAGEQSAGLQSRLAVGVKNLRKGSEAGQSDKFEVECTPLSALGVDTRAESPFVKGFESLYWEELDVPSMSAPCCIRSAREVEDGIPEKGMSISSISVSRSLWLFMAAI